MSIFKETTPSDVYLYMCVHVEINPNQKHTYMYFKT